MMRPLLPVWLALSLAANAVLLVVCVTRGTDAMDERADVRASISSVSAVRAELVGEVDVSGLAPEVVAKIGEGDEATLRDLLLACGLEPKAVRWLVEAAVARRFEAEKIAAIMRHRGKGWWKAEPDWWANPARKEIEARQAAEAERLAGDLPETIYPWRDEKMDFLPQEKQAALRALDRDYEELEDALPSQPWLPREQAMYSRLQEEKRLDLEALLSREELAEYDFREEADYFARDLDKYGITDAELRLLWQADKERDAAIDALTKRFGDRYGGDPFAGGGPDWPPEAHEAEKRLKEEYDAKRMAVLGEERITRGNRYADGSFKNIARVTDKFGHDRDKAEAIFSVLEHTKTLIEGEADVINEYERARFRDAAWAEIGEQVSPEELMLLKKSVESHYWLTPPL